MINPEDPDWKAANAALDEIEKSGKKIKMVIFSGHGSVFCPGRLVDVKDKNSEAYKFLTRLKRLLADDASVDIRACNVAEDREDKQGKDYCIQMATFLQAHVRAIDDWYAILPHGTEYTFHPDGTYKTTNQYKPWRGSRIRKYYQRQPIEIRKPRDSERPPTLTGRWSASDFVRRHPMGTEINAGSRRMSVSETPKSSDMAGTSR